jgi:hypothetical protein
MLSYKEEKTVVENSKQRLDNIYDPIPTSTKILCQLQDAYSKLERVEESLEKDIENLRLKQSWDMNALEKKPFYIRSDIIFFIKQYDKALLEET